MLVFLTRLHNKQSKQHCSRPKVKFLLQSSEVMFSVLFGFASGGSPGEGHLGIPAGAPATPDLDMTEPEGALSFTLKCYTCQTKCPSHRNTEQILKG